MGKPGCDAISITQKTSLRSRNQVFKNKKPSEAETEKDFIWPALESMGWEQIQVQQNLSTKGRKQVPDALLFADQESQAKALEEEDHWRRYQFGLAIVEAKKWDRSLDRASSDDGAPSTQMLQYLSRVDVQTSSRSNLPTSSRAFYERDLDT